MSSSSRRNQSQDPKPESPLSDRSPRRRDPSVPRKKSRSEAPRAHLSPKTPLPLPGSTEMPKRPRRYSTETVTNFRLEEVHRPTDKVVHVDLEEIEKDIRGGTPSPALSVPANGSLNDSMVATGPKTSTPKKSSRKSRREPDSLYKKVLMRSASRSAVRQPVFDSSMDSYTTAKESPMSPVRIDTAGYRSPNSTVRALFSQQGAAPLPRRSFSRTRTLPPYEIPSTDNCQLITPLTVHTAQEVNAVAATGQVLVISQTLVRSVHASNNISGLMNHLAGKRPLISNEMSQVDMDHDNETSKHEVFVGSDAILIQRISTIHRGRDRNSWEANDCRTYRFVCQGDLLPEDRRVKATKPRQLTIFAESRTVKDNEEIEKSERVVLIFDAADKPTKWEDAVAAETSLTSTRDLASRPSALKNSPVSFEEHVRVSDHSHINIDRKAHVKPCDLLWDEPLTELKEQRVYKQELSEDAPCEPVRITRSHSMSRMPVRDRSLSASRRSQQQTPSGVERGRTPGRSRNSSVMRPLSLSPHANSRSDEARINTINRERREAPTLDEVTCISPIRDEPARRELPRRRNPTFDAEDTDNDSPSLPSRTSPEPKRQQLQTHQSLPSKTALLATPRSASRSPAKRPTTPLEQLKRQWQSPRTPTKTSPEEDGRPRSMRAPNTIEQQITPLRTARQNTPTRPAVIIDEDTSAGSSQSPSRQNRTPTTVSPRRSRLTTAVYQSPAATPAKRRRTVSPSRDPSMDEWDRMLDATQPASPMAADRSFPADYFPASAPASDSRLARSKTRPAPFTSARSGPTPVRPLGPAQSCSNLDQVGLGPSPLQQLRPQQQPLRVTPPRRALSEHSVFQTPSRSPPTVAHRTPAAPNNSAIAIATPYRGQLYVRPPPVPRPRTTRPSVTREEPPSSDPSTNVTAISASASVTRRPDSSAAKRESSVPRTGKQSPQQKNVEVVHNPDDFAEGEILKKRLTLEAKINGHMWNLSVTFALKAERADMVRFAPKRVRIDDQTLWEETENWSQTSLTPVTGPRTEARGSNSYDQVLLQPVESSALRQPGSATASTQTPSVQIQSSVRVEPKGLATASTASSASSSKRSADKAKKVGMKSSSKNSKSSEKKNKGTPI